MEEDIKLWQNAMRNNSEDLTDEFRDFRNWEKLMQHKDQELKREITQRVSEIYPPVRNTNKKKSATKESKSTENPKKTKSHDYAAEKMFDADQARNTRKMDEYESDESNDSSNEFLSKEALQNRNKAIEYKQEGNCFVQQKEWAKAIISYNKAINIFPYDAIFFANRALCFLKQDNLYSAEADCTSSIKIDDTYMKAYFRRATARMGLKCYKEAKQDIKKVLSYEPFNKEAKALLNEIDMQLKLKPVITSEKNIADDISAEEKIAEKKLDNVKSNKKIIDIKEDDHNENNINIKSTVKPTSISAIKQMGNSCVPDWLPEKDNVKIVEPIKKPPHLRSKESFMRISVQEADLTKPFKEEIKASCIKSKDAKLLDISSVDTKLTDNESITKTEATVEKNFTEIYTEVSAVPKTAVQFIMNWKKYTSPDFRYKYLKQLPPGSLPKIFKDSMESSIFSDILIILRKEFIKREEPIFSYLKDLSDVRRFRTFIMFISDSEKQDLKFMFSYSKMSEKISKEEFTELQNKYEI